MATVAIPESHFLRSIKRQYSYPDAAIVREALQNSIDAGATRISVTVSPEGWFEVDDDGRGMTEERMVNALLTFGGSDKEAGAIGGFGLAKELLLFSHACYEVHSRDIHVKGKVLHYELTHGEFRQGTRIRLYFHEEYGFDYNSFMNHARDTFSSSEFACEVTLNGETVPGTPKGRTVRVFPWGKVHCRKREDGMPIYYATVRSKGLKMFQHYVGTIDRDVIVEVTGDAKDIFTATRDRFSGRYSDELQALFNELTVDKRSFGRKINERMMYSGDKGAFDDLVLKQTCRLKVAPTS